MSWQSREHYAERKRLVGVRRTVRARAALVRSAISQRDREKEPWHELVVMPGAVVVRTGGWRQGRDGNGGERGIVLGWSARSRQRLRLIAASIVWPDSEYLFLTLTYPRDFPRDPAVFKAHLNAFRSAWERKYGKAHALWAQEFQARGAVHFHVVIVAPAAPLPLVRRWFATTWHRIATGCAARHVDAKPGEVVCTSDPAHYERHLVDEHCKAATGARAAIGYLQRELGKEAQKSLPAYLKPPRTPTDAELERLGDAAESIAELEAEDAMDLGAQPVGAGRWWAFWGFEREERRTTITADEYRALRQLTRRIGMRVIVPQQRAQQIVAKAIALAKGRRWTARRTKLGTWTRPRHGLQGLSAIDPRLRAWSYGDQAVAFLEQLRGATKPRGTFASLDRYAPGPRFGWA